MLDTLQYSQRLQAAGMKPDLANAQAQALKEAMDESVATKAQLEAVEQRLSNDIAQLRQEIRSETGQIRQELRAESKHLRWVGGATLTMSGVSITLTTAVLIKLLLM